jgi:hypothetical protein
MSLVEIVVDGVTVYSTNGNSQTVGSSSYSNRNTPTSILLDGVSIYPNSNNPIQRKPDENEIIFPGTPYEARVGDLEGPITKIHNKPLTSSIYTVGDYYYIVPIWPPNSNTFDEPFVASTTRLFYGDAGSNFTIQYPDEVGRYNLGVRKVYNKNQEISFASFSEGSLFYKYPNPPVNTGTQVSRGGKSMKMNRVKKSKSRRIR